MGEIFILSTLKILNQKKESSVEPKEFIKQAAIKGDLYNVDMTVGDIYGNKCDFLPIKLIASSLGKASQKSNDFDVLKSFIFLILSNVAFTARQIVN